MLEKRCELINVHPDSFDLLIVPLIFVELKTNESQIVLLVLFDAMIVELRHCELIIVELVMLQLLQVESESMITRICVQLLLFEFSQRE